MRSSSNSYQGMGFFSVLSLIFIVLKLCNIIQWSWLWVLSPIWISWIIALVIIIWLKLT